jgi:hypothetical protein
MTLTPGNHSENMGSPTDPQIVYANDHLTLNGNGKGYGVLIVDRRLRMEGNYEFYGIILVLQQGEVEIRGNNKVYGAIFALNTGAFSGNSGETRLDVRGNAEVHYSSQAICNASRSMPSKVLAWQLVS